MTDETKQAISMKQSEIMDLGIRFTQQIQNYLTQDQYENLLSFFEANEYGVAIDLFQAIQENRSIPLSEDDQNLLSAIEDRMKWICDNWTN